MGSRRLKDKDVEIARAEELYRAAFLKWARELRASVIRSVSEVAMLRQLPYVLLLSPRRRYRNIDLNQSPAAATNSLRFQCARARVRYSRGSSGWSWTAH